MNHWPVVLFGNCIDVAAVAAFIIWLVNIPDWKASEGRRRRRLFLLELSHELIMPHVQRQSLKPTLQAPIRMAMQMIGIARPVPPQQAQQAVGDSKRKRCCLCPRAVDKKVRLEYGTCSKPVCTDHSTQQVVCDQCL